MAASKKNTPAEPTVDMNTILKDVAQFLPEGFSLDDFQSVGGLRPICAPEFNNAKPVLGYIVAELDMPPRKDKSTWTAILVTLLSPAMAKAGEDIVEIPPGRDVLIPVGGSLKNNGDLRAAAADQESVFLGIFTVTGQIDVGQQSDMWDYDVRVALDKPKARTGAFALYNKPAAPALPAGFATGEVLDKNGKSVHRLVG